MGQSHCLTYIPVLLWWTCVVCLWMDSVLLTLLTISWIYSFCVINILCILTSCPQPLPYSSWWALFWSQLQWIWLLDPIVFVVLTSLNWLTSLVQSSSSLSILSQVAGFHPFCSRILVHCEHVPRFFVYAPTDGFLGSFLEAGLLDHVL